MSVSDKKTWAGLRRKRDACRTKASVLIKQDLRYINSYHAWRKLLS